MKEFIEYIAKNLVDHPEQVKIEETVEQDGVINYNLTVSPEDAGKVIGKKGRTARAIRTLLIAIGSKNGKKISFEIPSGILKNDKVD